ncbi:MAG TPA: thioredoxin family protein [Streptosporangiaceae bacterium]|jgi:thiol-disulfide isomerase/thioredoxin|nr:thioredoxin family protein [Streptosporangiaceae bacterium]
MTAGVIALIVVLVVVTPLGLIWRRRQGQLRAPRPGSVRAAAPATAAGPAGPGVPESPARGRLTATDLRQDLGPRATLVQFSSSFCAPCRATRQVLGDVARLVDGVAYVEIDAESRLDLVRRLNVLSTPTVLVLDPDGAITRQATGQPRKPDVITALGEVITGSESATHAAGTPSVTPAGD